MNKYMIYYLTKSNQTKNEVVKANNEKEAKKLFNESHYVGTQRDEIITIEQLTWGKKS